MKYFFLSDGWAIGRVWELGGLWNEGVWRRKPQLEKTNLYILEQHEQLWLYQVEDAILMVEVKPLAVSVEESNLQAIGQVVLKRLITAEQAISRLNLAEAVFCNSPSKG